MSQCEKTRKQAVNPTQRAWIFKFHWLHSFRFEGKIFICLIECFHPTILFLTIQFISVPWGKQCTMKNRSDSLRATRPAGARKTRPYKEDKHVKGVLEGKQSRSKCLPPQDQQSYLQDQFSETQRKDPNECETVWEIPQGGFRETGYFSHWTLLWQLIALRYL